MPPPCHPTADDPVAVLLINLLRARWDPNALLRARTLTDANPPDWDAVAARIDQERIGPLLFPGAVQQAIFPAPLLRRLEKQYLATLQRNLTTAPAITELQQAFQAAGVPAILLKGAALIADTYGDPGVRPMADIDFLVPREALSTTITVAQRLGFRLSEQLREELSRHGGDWLLFEHGYTLLRERPRVAIEIHWTLLSSPYYQQTLDLEWFRQATRPSTAGSLLGVSAQLLHLCGHAALHHGEGMLLLHDVAEFIARHGEELDWPAVTAQAARQQFTLFARQVLPPVAELWKVPIPAPALAALAAQRPTWREALLYRSYTARKPPLGWLSFAECLCLRGLGTQARFARQKFATSQGAVPALRRLIRRRLIPSFLFNSHRKK